VAVAYLPAVVSLLLLETLFMQISGVSLTLTSPSGFVYLKFSWAQPPLLQAFSFPSTLGEVTLHQLSQACMFIYSSRGKWVFPLSCGVFLLPPLLQAFPVLIAGQCHCSCLLQLACEGFSLPPSLALRAPHLLCYMSFLLLLLIIQFLLFPWVGVGLSRGLC
jgi:hypothetical protein